MSAEKLNLTYHSNCITLQYKIRYVLHFGTIQPLTVLKSQKYQWKNVVISNIADHQPATLLKIRFFSRRL